MTGTRRPRHRIPLDVRAALTTKKLLVAYRARPAYQQNDYVGWIMRAKRADTRTRRLTQMLDELRRGGVYMKASWKARAKPQTPRTSAASRRR